MFHTVVVRMNILSLHFAIGLVFSGSGLELASNDNGDK